MWLFSRLVSAVPVEFGSKLRRRSLSVQGNERNKRNPPGKDESSMGG